MAEFVIVTGPGRSGTSAVARILHESGLTMGDAFAPGNAFNATGFYEDTAVVDLNERVLRDCGMEGMRTWPSRQALLAAAAPYAREMRDIARATVALGWKDPRFAVTLEAWLPHLPSRPRVVVCLRSPLAFAHSSITVFGLPASLDVLEDWWAMHLRTALDVIRDHQLDATSVAYEELIARPGETVRKLSRFVRHPLDARYLEPSLRHHEDPVPPHHLPLYDEVRALAWAAPD